MFNVSLHNATPLLLLFVIQKAENFLRYERNLFTFAAVHSLATLFKHMITNRKQMLKT